MASIEDEIVKALSLSRKVIGAYLEWYDKIQFTDIYNTVYSDMLDFVNFRVETADSCLDLIGRNKVADSHY